MAECRLIKSGEAYRPEHGLTYFTGIAAETAGSEHLCMQIVEIPAGAQAKAHFHAGHETAIFMLEGQVEMLHGAALEHKMVMRPGDLVYIPAGVPHRPMNLGTQRARALIARTDPNVVESIHLCPELEEPAQA